MQRLPLSLIAHWVNGELYGNSDDIHDIFIEHISRDSRDIVSGSLYIGLRGENFDGQQFAANAVASGAVAILVECVIAEIEVPQIIVLDSLVALGKIAHHIQKERQGKVFALTGSNGKTTLKTLLLGILNQAGNAYANPGNYNNEIGLPLSIIGAPQNIDFDIYEMGAGQYGDIDYLVDIVSPDIACINNIAAAHLQRMEHLFGVASTKAAIYKHLTAKNTAIINADDSFAPWFFNYIKCSDFFNKNNINKNNQNNNEINNHSNLYKNNLILNNKNTSGNGELSGNGKLSTCGEFSASGDLSEHGKTSAVGNLSEHGKLSADGNFSANGDLSKHGKTSSTIKKENLSLPTILFFGLSGQSKFLGQPHITARHIELFSEYSRFILITPMGEIPVQLSLPGFHNIKNALAASAMAYSAGVSLHAIAEGLSKVQPIAGRQVVHYLSRDSLQKISPPNLTTQATISLIDDSYNANPASLSAGIDTVAQAVRLASRPTQGWLVLGDMRELGIHAQALHQDIGRYAKKQGLSRLYCLGEWSAFAADVFGSDAQCFSSHHELTTQLVTDFKNISWDGDIVCLVKGSRGSAMDRIVNALLAPQESSHHVA